MQTQQVVFGGGCFWCTEAAFKQLKGVVSVTPGYAGGPVMNAGRAPTYEEVCGGKTGHAEVVRVEFDPTQITFQDLLSVFFTVHDPTTLNRQGNDVGTQYRSAIYYTTDVERQEIERFVRELEHAKVFDDPILTEVQELGAFYEAEEYHQNYYAKNPDQAYCQAIINPKLKKLREKHAELIAR
ncbi:MAG: peptide-methionine (S)-S-oxide reductase MsrA [Parcubacteria group bacterium]|nr:peptide-methionine (S)-S-oxide reductase MsrA [Parcubacteria group bacterium]